MIQQPDLLKKVGQDPKEIEKELQKDEEYSKLLKAEEKEIDNDTHEFLENWIKVYRLRLHQDFENRAVKDTSIEQFNADRDKQMLSKNPKFILRNHLAQECIEKAEEGDYTMVDELLKVLETPFDEHEDAPKEWSDVPPKKAYDICVSCSS